MFSDRVIIRDLAITHCDGEGEWDLCSANECHVGEDD